MKYNIEVTEDCIKALKSKSQFNGNEDCGIIFGSQISDERIRINSVSESCCVQKFAKNCSCNLDVGKANNLIKEEFEKSNHTRFYIGEWHTHPEDNPCPSHRDLVSIKESYNKNNIPISDIIIMAIIGRKSICWKQYNGQVYSDVNITQLS